jgi:LPXTG-motif cell wall-anchored protein
LKSKFVLGHPPALVFDGWQIRVPTTGRSGTRLPDKGETKMNIRLNALWLGGFLAVSSFLAQPVRADEWNKRTEFEFSAPVEIPGKVLAPGKYVFELEDSDSDRNIVQVFSKDSAGNETLVATTIAIPDYTSDTPDKPIVHFEERQPESPEAIHSWFYPGDNTGWEFVYSKGETPEATATTTPAPAPVAAAAAPSLPAPPQVQDAEPSSEAAVLEEETLIAQTDMPAPPPAQGDDTQSPADRTLPQTGGYSDLQLMAGLVMLGGGIAAVFASRRKSLA